jgi:hypothetical protein
MSPSGEAASRSDAQELPNISFYIGLASLINFVLHIIIRPRH